jgi:hypothetical protein
MEKKILVLIAVFTVVWFGLIGNANGREVVPPLTPLTIDGTYYKVVGVRSDDVLWIRNAPDPNANSIGSIPPNGRCVLSGDDSAYYKGSRWVQVWYKNIHGWVNARFLGEDNQKYCAHPGSGLSSLATEGSQPAPLDNQNLEKFIGVWYTGSGQHSLTIRRNGSFVQVDCDQSREHCKQSKGTYTASGNTITLKYSNSKKTSTATWGIAEIDGTPTLDGAYPYFFNSKE